MTTPVGDPTVTGGFEHSFFRLTDARLHVVRAGSGPALVLLHGWPEASFTWRLVMERLADKFTLIAPDLRGFGESDKPTGPFGPQDQADDIAALIQHSGLGPVGIVAHDVGASVAQALARRYPELITGLFFFNLVYPGIGDRFYRPDHLRSVWHTFFNQSDLAPLLLRASPNGVRLYVTHWITTWSYRKDAFDPATMDEFVHNMERPGNLEGGFTYYKSVADQRAREAKGETPPTPIGLPTCIRWTERDPALDIAWSDRLGEFFIDLDFASFPRAGHFPHHEDPPRAAAEIAGFFERLALRAYAS
jgi:pimeloyl-ACP methyl ester carboxylesterase